MIALGQERDLFFVQIVRARATDSPALSAIAWAAKAHWGYPTHWLEQWRELLTITPAFIAENETFKACDHEQVVGFHALRKTGTNWRLEHLWMLPERIGQGIGRKLFAHAIARAKARGASRLTIESDPHAEAFYRRMGAQRIGFAVTEIDGARRELPLLEFDLTRPPALPP